MLLTFIGKDFWDQTTLNINFKFVHRLSVDKTIAILATGITLVAKRYLWKEGELVLMK